MIAAAEAARAGHAVTLLERNEKLGKKLYITGKGRCNVTNCAERDAFFAAVTHNPRFLYSAFAAFDNQAVQRLIESLGVPLKTERGAGCFLRRISRATFCAHWNDTLEIPASMFA